MTHAPTPADACARLESMARELGAPCRVVAHPCNPRPDGPKGVFGSSITAYFGSSAHYLGMTEYAASTRLEALLLARRAQSGGART